MKMKKLIFIITCAMMAGSLWAQHQLEALSELKNVEYVHFDKSAISEIAKNKGSIDVGDNSIVKDASGDILKLLDEVYVITADAKRAAKKVKKSAQSFIKTERLRSILDVKGDKKEQVKIYHSQNGEDAHTCALLVNDNGKTVFVVLKGDLNLGDLIFNAMNKD